MERLGHAADGLGPAEGCFNLLPAPLGQGVSKMLSGPSVDGEMSDLLRDMRGHDPPSEFSDEVGAVVFLVRPERQAPGQPRGMPTNHFKRRLPLAMPSGMGQLCLHDKTIPGFHQRMPHEAQHRRGTRRLLVEPGFRVRDRCMGHVRALLTLEVLFGVARLAGRVGHRLGLGLLGLVGSGGGLVSWWRSPARIVLVRCRPAFLRLKALH